MNYINVETKKFCVAPNQVVTSVYYLCLVKYSKVKSMVSKEKEEIYGQLLIS